MRIEDLRWGRWDVGDEPGRSDGLRVDPAWSPARLSLEIMRSAWPWITAGGLLLMLSNAATMLVPVVVGVVAPLTHGATIGALASALAWCGLALVALYLVMHVAQRFGGRLGWYGVQRAQHELAQRVVGRVLDDRGMAEPRAPGTLLSLATGDVRRACLVLGITVYPPGHVAAFAVATGVLLSVHVWLGVGVVVALAVTLWLMHAAARPLQRRSATEQAGLAAAAGSAADLVSGYRVLRGLHAQRVAAERYRAVSRKALAATLSARSAAAAFEGLRSGASQLFAAGVVVAAAWLAFDGQVSVGGFVTVAGIAVSLINPVDALVGAIGMFWVTSQASARRLLDLLGTRGHPAALGTGEREGGTRGTLELRGVALPGGIRLDLDLDRGSLVALQLPQAAQAALVERLSLTATGEGDVLLDDRPIDTLRPDVVRRALLVAPRTPGMLAGTVLDEVRATGDERVGEAVARAALARACLLERELPDGYRTRVGEGGSALSGGQRQRVALARALAASPDVLVLVEPTTSVDAVTEARIAEGLRGGEGTTTLVLGASPAVLAVADRVEAHRVGA